MEALIEQATETVCGTSRAVKELQKSTGVKGQLSEKVLEEISAQMGSILPNERRAFVREALTRRKEELLDETLMFRDFDPAKHTPVELLHTFLLGVAKYLWHETFSSLSASNRQTFAERLRNISHLSIVGPKTSQAEYIKKYPNSLIGRHLKEIMQLGVFALDDLPINNDLLRLWLDLGRLTTLVWFTKVSDIERFRQNLRAAIANVLDGFSILYPAKIVRKIKLHILVHLEEDILAFGPLPGVTSERFESYNAVFRHSAVNSNRQHPSRDIAMDCAGQERVKQTMSGGYLRDGEVWRVPSSSLAGLATGTPILDDNFTLEKPSEPPGNFTISAAAQQRDRISFSDDAGVLGVKNKNDFPSLFQSLENAQSCEYVVSREKDRCYHNSWVVARRGTPIIGRVSRLLCYHGKSYIVLDVFKLSKEKDSKLEMPLLIPSHQSVMIESKSLLFDFNVQETRGQFLINNHSLHHQDLLYQVIPGGLFDVSCRFEDREQLHHRMAEKLRERKTQGDT